MKDYVLIVLGGPVQERNGKFEPGVWLKSRLTTTVYAHKYPKMIFPSEKSPHPPIATIVTGGTSSNIFPAESTVMANYLFENDVNNVFMESLARNTYENAIYSLEIVKELLIIGKKFKHICVLTSDFHIERSKMIFDQVFQESGLNLSYIQAVTPVDKGAMKLLVKNEKMLIRKIIMNQSSKTIYLPN